MARKKIRFVLCIALILHMLMISTYAASDTAQDAIRQGNHICAPFRNLWESFDYLVSWSNGTAIASGEHTIQARPGSTTITVDGTEIRLPAAVQLKDGCTYVPVRAMCEALGMEVTYDPQTDTAAVRSVNRAVSMKTPEEANEYQENDIYWLARIVEAEARGESSEGKLAVANVVLNRVASEEYPDTIYDVIFDTKYGVQFEPVSIGTIYNEPSEDSIEAAKKALNGENVAGNAIYFYNPSVVDAAWIRINCEYICTIGCHKFYH